MTELKDAYIPVVGGMSDRGYSSMTLDDAKRASIIIGSQDSLDSLSKQNSSKVEKREHPKPISKISMRKERSKSDGITNEKGTTLSCSNILSYH